MTVLFGFATDCEVSPIKLKYIVLVLYFIALSYDKFAFDSNHLQL